ncbi:hypothetical protein C8Q76DRAFT_226049 [Earliella scabrosa]|nr:hypothetical protein C8Q76DRAFT_226049 [Earliella scabrosa]
MRTRERVSAAARSALGLVTDVVHELLDLGADFLPFVPVPSLELAALVLSAIGTRCSLSTSTGPRASSECSAVRLSSSRPSAQRTERGQARSARQVLPGGTPVPREAIQQAVHQALPRPG